jgi:hypothetical protein
VKLMGLYGRWVVEETPRPAIIAKESAEKVFKMPFLRIFNSIDNLSEISIRKKRSTYGCTLRRI